ncbi:hypothetical protein [Halorubrum tebenquichense]|uniref:Uncharacterized protein n=1 Tax=Halorubrum tebenquichense DSM 14210 TaxID=1227485 RepID=M0DVM6_9EURY|nr:hypothetical protein [Halorubrum tebenquichense]ELZ38883.1 hypothetical protein C472_05703 [Halorubrum tebenquichense DSM 14210]
MSNLKDAILGGGAGLVAIDGLWSVVDLGFAFADVAYVPLSVAFGTLAPNVDFISQETLQPVMVFVALLYVSNLLIKRIQRYRNGDSDD